MRKEGAGPLLSKQTQPFSQLQAGVDHVTEKAAAMQHLMSLALPGESKHSLG